LGNVRRGNELATKCDQKCYPFWLQSQPLMNKVAYSTVLSQSKNQHSVSVYTQLHISSSVSLQNLSIINRFTVHYR